MRLSRVLYGSLLAIGSIAGGEAFVVRGEAFFFTRHAQGGSAAAGHRAVTAQKTTIATLVPSWRPLCVGGTPDATSSSRSSTLLFAEGPSGAPTPNGPGTPNLSREAKLLISVLIDVIGVSSFAVPGVGEVSFALLGWRWGSGITRMIGFLKSYVPSGLSRHAVLLKI